jgi:hypothetical protein
MYKIELTVEERIFLENVLSEELENNEADLEEDEEEGQTEEESDIDNEVISFLQDILIKTENAKEVANLNLRLLAELIEDRLSFDADTDITGTTGELREELKKIDVLINGGE